MDRGAASAWPYQRHPRKPRGRAPAQPTHRGESTQLLPRVDQINRASRKGPPCGYVVYCPQPSQGRSVIGWRAEDPVLHIVDAEIEELQPVTHPSHAEEAAAPDRVPQVAPRQRAQPEKTPRIESDDHEVAMRDYHPCRLTEQLVRIRAVLESVMKQRHVDAIGLEGKGLGSCNGCKLASPGLLGNLESVPHSAVIIESDTPADPELHQVEAEQPGQFRRRHGPLGAQNLETKPALEPVLERKHIGRIRAVGHGYHRESRLWNTGVAAWLPGRSDYIMAGPDPAPCPYAPDSPGTRFQR